MNHPELVVFDLDFTLWDCGGTWCDCLAPPFERRKNQVLDRNGRVIRLYAHVDEILDYCDLHEIPMALASRTEQPTWAKELIELLGIAHRFQFAEIYPASKLKHFARLQRSSGAAFDRMLFFDDEMRNIIDIRSLGVTCVHVEDGIHRALFEEGVRVTQLEP